MGQIGSIIADACSPGIRYAQRLVQGIPENRFARLSVPGGHTVQTNHPAFVLGHLTLYPVRVFELLGQDATPAKIPTNYNQLFSKDATCQDDPEGTRYPNKQELLDCFIRCYESAMGLLRRTDDVQLLIENPLDTPLKQLCPKLASLLAFYMTGHVMSHLGQVSAWRRMEGLPPA